MARRRRVSRAFAGRSQGRTLFWYRFTPFGVPLVEAATATHADILLTPSDWMNPVLNINEAKRGGPRLERLIVEFGLAVDASSGFWSSGGDANIALIPEFMLWKQSEQFAAVVTDSASFDATRSEQRVIMDMIPGQDHAFSIAATESNTPMIRSVYGTYSTKVKVNLTDSALGIGWRGLFNTGSANLRGYTDWVRPTLLISTP